MNLPNIITCSRVVILGLIVWLIFETWIGAATVTFLLALIGAISDWLDGWLARRNNQISDFGKIMDALIDKVFVIGLFVLLVLLERLPVWSIPIIILVILRDGLITGLRGAAARKGIVLAADNWGKRKTIWQVTCICVLLFVPVVERDIASFTTVSLDVFAEWVRLNGLLYFLFSSGLALFSGGLYLMQYGRLLRGGERTLQ